MGWCDVSVCEYHEMLKLLHPSNICQCFMENLLNLSSSFLRHRGDCCSLVSLLCTSSAGMLAALVTAPSGQLFHTSPRFLDFDNHLLTFNFQEMDIFRFHSRWVLIFRAFSTQGPLSVCLVPLTEFHSLLRLRSVPLIICTTLLQSHPSLGRHQRCFSFLVISWTALQWMGIENVPLNFVFKKINFRDVESAQRLSVLGVLPETWVRPLAPMCL